MKNRKETLIETLRGSTQQLTQIPDLLVGVSIYDETGHVDSDFFTNCLQEVNRLMDASNIVISSITDMLGPCRLPDNKQTKASDEGSRWNVEEILQHCTLEDNVMKLPKVQFNKKSYAEAKKWIEEAGGSWTGGKVQGFTFPFNAERVFGILHEGKRCNLQQEFQYFATPAAVADWLVQLAGGVSETDKVLEPSAGTGAIVDAIRRSCPECEVDCFELMPENRELLAKKDGVNLIGEDFTKSDASGYDRIIANPPFSRNQDIDHVMTMYERLTPGGVIAAIMSQHWRFANEKKCIDFRRFLDDVGANIHEIAAGEFQESGTGISTIAVVIKKRKKKNNHQPLKNNTNP